MTDSPVVQDDPTALKTPAELAKASPKAVFEQPIDVLVDTTLTTAEKVEVLDQWKSDEAALQVADDEGMAPGAPADLDDVNKAKTIADRQV